MRSVDDYLALIPPLNARKPNFRAVVTAAVASYADAQSFLAALSQDFDLDTAVGVQLDVVGQWVGQSRIITIPANQPWFSWGIAGKGWGQGYWKGPAIYENTYTPLDDDDYRRLLYAKIAANYTDGQVDGAQAALSLYFTDPATYVFVEDVSPAIGALPVFAWGVANHGWGQGYWGDAEAVLNDNLTEATQPTAEMHWEIGVAGKLPRVVDLEILAQNLIPVTPAGVNRDVRVVTVDNTPLFGWGMTNQYVSGWGVGSWGAPPEYVTQNILEA